MRFVIDPIACDNDAFSENPREEVARILRDLSTRLEDGSETRGGLYDLNGNRVAGWWLDTDDN